MKRKLLIAAPYLKNIGGTEIEAVSTAAILWDTGKFSIIEIFSPQVADKSLFDKMIGDRPIQFITYPDIFSSYLFKKFNGLLRKLGVNFNVFEYIYWKYYTIYDFYFIITNVRNSFSVPIVIAQTAKKIILKIAMYHYEQLSLKKRKSFERSSHILVFNEDQKKFWKERNMFSNVEYLDVITPNEENLLRVEINKFERSGNLVFGYMGRISKEKNIEDMVLLLDFLNNQKNQNCELHICGVGDESYVNSIWEMIYGLNLSQFIKFENSIITPMATELFFDKIDVFLVTSLHEGGPITSLQAAAAGRIVLGYDVGAMKERFSKIANSVNADLNELCLTAYSLIKLPKSQKVQLGERYREIYVNQLNNSIKVIGLLNLFSLDE